MNQANNLKVLIPNATSAKNIGDVAMQQVLTRLLQQSHQNPRIDIHMAEPHTCPDFGYSSIRPTLYYWAVFQNQNPIIRLIRTILVWTIIIVRLVKLYPLAGILARCHHTLHQIYLDYTQSDQCIFVGGGYLRSKPGISQVLNLLMQLSPFLLASTTSAKTITAPIGFGPFAYPWQSKLCAWILNRINIVTIREEISFTHATAVGLSCIRCSDHALLLPFISSNTPQSKQIGFTIRSWLDSEGDKRLIQAYIQALIQLSQDGFQIVPIIQVDAPGFGEGDAVPTNQVHQGLVKQGAKVSAPIKIASVSHAQQIYGQLYLLIGMRMHSNIIAATQQVPFVSIAYEYKTQGIARDLGLEEFCLNCASLDGKKIYQHSNTMINQYPQMKNILKAKLNNIQSNEEMKWEQILKS